MPNGEPDSVIRWDLAEHGENDTIVTVTFSRLTKPTGLGFAPGMHAFLDRLEAHLDQVTLPDWMERYAEVKKSYPSWPV